MSTSSQRRCSSSQAHLSDDDDDAAADNDDADEVLLFTSDDMASCFNIHTEWSKVKESPARWPADLLHSPHWHLNTQTDRQTDRQTDGGINRQADRQWYQSVMFTNMQSNWPVVTTRHDWRECQVQRYHHHHHQWYVQDTTPQLACSLLTRSRKANRFAQPINYESSSWVKLLK